ncbi:MAG: Arc family DNA binding domain-containing protein [Clostridia bacterium]|nr:Arc family DNA binding domain-containing protein [Clostridia bacterium]
MAEKKTIPLRLSTKMWEEISKWAENEFRSINGQIEYILNEAIQKRKKLIKSKASEEGNDGKGEDE